MAAARFATRARTRSFANLERSPTASCKSSSGMQASKRIASHSGDSTREPLTSTSIAGASRQCHSAPAPGSTERARIGHDAVVFDEEIVPSQGVNEDRSAVTSSGDAFPGGLYVVHGAVAARAIAGAVADRNPRRRAYLRHVVLAAGLFVIVGVALAIAGAMPFD